MGSCIYAHVKRESGRRRMNGWEKHFIFGGILGLVTHFYFIIILNKLKGTLQCGCELLSAHFSPALLMFKQGHEGITTAHTDLCSDAAWRMQCVAMEHSKLTGSHRSRPRPWPFIISILYSANQNCRPWETEEARVLCYECIHQLSSDKQEKILMCLV